MPLEFFLSSSYSDAIGKLFSHPILGRGSVCYETACKLVELFVGSVPNLRDKEGEYKDEGHYQQENYIPLSGDDLLEQTIGFLRSNSSPATHTIFHVFIPYHHAFIIEQVCDEKKNIFYRIYQSCACQYSLSDWLNRSDLADEEFRHSDSLYLDRSIVESLKKDAKYHFEYHKPTQHEFGQGKLLTIEELTKFMNELVNFFKVYKIDGAKIYLKKFDVNQALLLKNLCPILPASVSSSFIDPRQIYPSSDYHTKTTLISFFSFRAKLEECLYRCLYQDRMNALPVIFMAYLNAEVDGFNETKKMGITTELENLVIRYHPLIAACGVNEFAKILVEMANQEKTIYSKLLYYNGSTLKSFEANLHKSFFDMFCANIKSIVLPYESSHDYTPLLPTIASIPGGAGIG